MQPANEGGPQPPQQPYYPPQQYGQPPYQQPMYQPTPPRKRSRVWLWIVLGVLAVLLLGCAGIVALVTSAAKTGTNTIATTIATTVPTTAAKTSAGQKNWTTTHTFTGSGSKKTGIFSVPADWKINWTCKPSSFTGNQYNLVIFVYNSDNTLADSGVNTICKAGNTSDSTEIHTSGQVYLNIISEGDWTIQVQESK